MDACSSKIQETNDTAEAKAGGLDNLASATGSAAVESGSVAYDDRPATFLRISEQRREQLVWMAQRMTDNREDAEDIVQEALLRAFKNLLQFRGASQMSTWLCVIVQNVGREWRRKQKGKIYVPLEGGSNEDNDPITYDPADPGRNPEQSSENKELEKILLFEIDGMNSIYRPVLQMCALEELPQRYVASALGINASAVKSRFFKATKILRRAIYVRLGARNGLAHSTKTAL